MTQADNLDSLLLLRIRCPGAPAQPNGAVSLEVEVWLDYQSIFPAATVKLDLGQLLASAAEKDNSYGQLLGQCLSSASSFSAALKKLGGSSNVRMQLMLEDPNYVLQNIRWERLELPFWTDPLGVGSATPFSRFAAVNSTITAAPEDSLFRLLLVVASPVVSGVYQISPDDECASVLDACAGLLDRNQIQITVMPGNKGFSAVSRARFTRPGVTIVDGPSSIENIGKLILVSGDSGGAPHGLHLVAHGTFDHIEREFFLLLESETGGLSAKSAEAIIQEWRPESLRLLFLESCQSAVEGAGPELRGFRENLGGFMQKLVLAGVPAVVAMQDVVTVASARAFNRGFYGHLLETGSVDDAANTGRQLMRGFPNAAWSIPAITTRLKNGEVWSESPLRRAGRLLYAKLQQNQQDRIFPDFPIDVVPLSTDILKTRSKAALTGQVDDVLVSNVAQIDVHRALALSLSQPDARPMILLLGNSGGSRTTLLETTFLRESKRNWEEQQPAIPVLLRLQDCIYSRLDPTSTFAAAVSKYFSIATGSEPPVSHLASRFCERPFLFLIIADDDFTQGTIGDGLRALNEFRRAAAGRQLGDFHRYVLTLDQKTVTVEDLPDNSESMMLQPMKAERVAVYLETLPADNGAKAAAAKAGATLLKSLRQNGLFDLAEVPWLLGEMLDQHRRGVQQTSRAEILKKTTDERICQVSGTLGIRDRVEDTIYRIAWEIQNRRERVLPGSDLFRILSELRGNRDFSLFEFRQHLIEDCRLLAPTREDGVRFAYPGFRAYCCAQYLLGTPEPMRERMLEEITATLGRRRRVDWWSETLILLAGLNPKKVFDLLRLILSGSPLNEGDQVFIAARCLQEARLSIEYNQHSNDEPVVSSIVSSLIYRSHPMSYGSVEVRKRALRYLAPLKEPSAIPHLVSLVLKKIRPGRENSREFDFSGVRLAAIKALLYYDSVADQIRNDPELAHSEALQVAVQHWLKLDIAGLQADLNSPDTNVASVAAFALCLLKPPGALDKLFLRFKLALQLQTESAGKLPDSDPDEGQNHRVGTPDLLWALADAMLELGDPKLADCVGEFMKVGTCLIYAAFLIGKLGTAHRCPEFVAFLWTNLSSADSALSGRCVMALAELGEDVRDKCHEWLSSPDNVSRYYALQGLRHVGDKESLAKLERLQWNDENTQMFEHLRLEVYDDLYWRLAGGQTREVMAPM